MSRYPPNRYAVQEHRLSCPFSRLPSHVQINVCSHVEGEEYQEFAESRCFCCLPDIIQSQAIDRYLTFEHFGQYEYIHNAGMVARAAYAYLKLVNRIPTSPDRRALVDAYRKDIQCPGSTACSENEQCLDKHHRHLGAKLKVRDIRPLMEQFAKIQAMNRAISDTEIDCMTDWAQYHQDDSRYGDLSLNHPTTEKLSCLYYVHAFWALFRRPVGAYDTSNRNDLEEEFLSIFHPGRREAICKIGTAAEYC